MSEFASRTPNQAPSPAAPPQWHRDRRAEISDRYARFYAPLAVSAIMLAFLPLFEIVVEQNEFGVSTSDYGSIFEMAARANGSPAGLGVILLGALVILLVVAAFRIRSAGVPVALAIVASLIALMLITKPGTGTPTPELSGSGLAGLVLMIGLVVLAIAHAIQLSAAPRGHDE
jgi:hypothetical protein